jgi:chemotaxis protein CheD
MLPRLQSVTLPANNGDVTAPPFSRPPTPQAAAGTRLDVPVGMGEARITARPADVLVVHGLGSCIALCLRDPVTRITGLAHVVLPRSSSAALPEAGSSRPAKFGDLAVPYLLEQMERAGARRERLKIAIVGGAQVLRGAERLDIGRENTIAVLTSLNDAGLMLADHDIGGSLGRVCRLHAGDGRLVVSAIGSEERVLTILGSAAVPAAPAVTRSAP